MAILFCQNVVKTCHQKTEKKNTDPDSFCIGDYLLESNIGIWQFKRFFFKIWLLKPQKTLIYGIYLFSKPRTVNKISRK